MILHAWAVEEKIVKLAPFCILTWSLWWVLSFLTGPSLNPLSPSSDQHQFSPKDIHRLSSQMVMRINKMINKEKMP